MSILPIEDGKRIASSSLESVARNPNNHNHGLSVRSSFPISSSGKLSPPAEASSSSTSRKVNKDGIANSDVRFSQQNGYTPPGSNGGCRGDGVALSRGKMPEATASIRTRHGNRSSSSPPGANRSGHGNGSASSPPGVAVQSSGRRNQMTNANHLLNFHYEPISRSQQRTPHPPPPRRQRKIKPYSKDLFLQANYKFVVLDTGDCSPELMDPDKMLRWEDIICVRHSTPFSVQCPICLDTPLCPQITSCGHIFCFPCILQYLFMGEDHKGDGYKRCPLCFVMISPKDLHTIYIENLKQYNVSDSVDFMLLTRQKNSFTPSLKGKQDLSCGEDINDPFSKFTFTSDVELSVRKAISDLDSWLIRADSGLVDDLEKLPYVCAAMEQLEKRKKYWNELQTSDNEAYFKHSPSPKGFQGLLRQNAAKTTQEASNPGSAALVNNDQIKFVDEVDPSAEGAAECHDAILSSSYDENGSSRAFSNGFNDIKERDSYNYYQAIDGQHLILHPLNMKCLLHHYGSYDLLPLRLSGKILQLEDVTQSEAMRKRYRYLSHFALTTTFQLCEIDLSEILPPEALIPFMDEIKRREKLRKQIAKKEHKEKIKAEAVAAAAHIFPAPAYNEWPSTFDTPVFSMDDFEALGSSNATPVSAGNGGEKLSFSNVTRLGFAAAHDSPALRIEETNNSSQVKDEASGAIGSRNTSMRSFANIMAEAKSGPEGVTNITTGKKGKKPNRVLLSTAGGRRY